MTLAAGGRELGEKKDFPPITLLPKQTASRPGLEMSCTPTQPARSVCRSKRRAGLPASAGEHPAFDTHPPGQQTKPAVCQSTTLGVTGTSPAELSLLASRPCASMLCPSGPAKPWTNQCQGEETPDGCISQEAPGPSPHSRQQRPPKPCLQLLPTQPQPCSWRGYPQQGTRSTSCSRTMGPPPSLELLMHPQVPSHQKKNQ